MRPDSRPRPDHDMTPSRGLARLRDRMPSLRRQQEGRWGYILAWLVGVPIPILVLIYLLRGCT